ncbi:hypothetical protein SALBM135S_08951 [Streptomyces alboniger]
MRAVQYALFLPDRARHCAAKSSAPISRPSLQTACWFSLYRTTCRGSRSTTFADSRKSGFARVLPCASRRNRDGSTAPAIREVPASASDWKLLSVSGSASIAQIMVPPSATLSRAAGAMS